MVSSENSPFLIEHVKILQILESSKIALENAIESDNQAIDEFNNLENLPNMVRFREAWSATRAHLTTALTILKAAQPEA